jgi:hypothetical protein
LGSSRSIISKQILHKRQRATTPSLLEKPSKQTKETQFRTHIQAVLTSE